MNTGFDFRLYELHFVFSKFNTYSSLPFMSTTFSVLKFLKGIFDDIKDTLLYEICLWYKDTFQMKLNG